jgi:transposase
VIDRVRVDQANQLRHDRPARRILKSSRWLLLRNRSNLLPEHSVRLKELLAANEPLLCVYLLREQLKQLWFYRKPAWATRAWQQWCGHAQESGIPALQLFAKRLQTVGTESSLAAVTSSTQAWSRGSTTPSKSSSAEPTAIATRSTSSSRSGRPSPEIFDEPKKGLAFARPSM